MILRRSILFLILAWFQVPLAQADQKFIGHFNFWKRPLCLQAQNCPLPQPFGQPWVSEFTLKKPLQLRTSTSQTVVHMQDPWTAQTTLYWMLPAPPERDYIVTQIRVLHKQFGLVFECSRFDLPEDIPGFTVGACSGRMGNEQIGITTKK